MSRRTSVFGTKLSSFRILSWGKSSKEKDDRLTRVCPMCGQSCTTKEGSPKNSQCCSEQCSRLLSSSTISSVGLSQPISPRRRKPITMGFSGRVLAKLFTTVPKRSPPCIEQGKEAPGGVRTPPSGASAITIGTIGESLPTTVGNSYYLDTSSQLSPPLRSPSISEARDATSLASSRPKPYLDVNVSYRTKSYETVLSTAISCEIPSPPHYYQDVVSFARLESSYMLTLTQDLSDRVRQIDRYPFETGGVADVYRGEMIANQETLMVIPYARDNMHI